MSTDKRGNEILAESSMKREKGYLYYVGENEDGYLSIVRVKAGRKEKK